MDKLKLTERSEMDIKKIEFYRDNEGRYSSSEAKQDDVSGTYYQAVDVDALINNLEQEVQDANDERDDAIDVLQNSENTESDRDALRELLLPALKVLESISANSDQEATYNGKITDVAGLVSDIKWQMKGAGESSDSVIG